MNKKHLIDETVKFVFVHFIKTLKFFLRALGAKIVCRENACQLIKKSFCVLQHVDADGV